MLDLLFDSTGIKFVSEGEWKRKKHRAEYRRQWRKVHLAIGAKTLEVRAIIPPRKYAQLWKASRQSQRVGNEAVRACERLGCKI